MAATCSWPHQVAAFSVLCLPEAQGAQLEGSLVRKDAGQDKGLQWECKRIVCRCVQERFYTWKTSAGRKLSHISFQNLLLEVRLKKGLYSLTLKNLTSATVHLLPSVLIHDKIKGQCSAIILVPHSHWKHSTVRSSTTCTVPSAQAAL